MHQLNALCVAPLLLLVAAACTHDSSFYDDDDDDGGSSSYDDGPGGGSQPLDVDVEIVGALIGPGKSSTGDTWDGWGSVDYEVLSDLAALINPTYGAVVDIIDGELDYFDAPDVYGSAYLNEGGGYGYEQALICEDENEFFVYWTGRPGWDGVRLEDGETRVRVELWDVDLYEDDKIGTATLTEEDLRAAYSDGGVYQVWVGDQTDEQLLFVGVEVW